jgi:hypothetical protein
MPVFPELSWWYPQVKRLLIGAAVVFSLAIAIGLLIGLKILLFMALGSQYLVYAWVPVLVALFYGVGCLWEKIRLKGTCL